MKEEVGLAEKVVVNLAGAWYLMMVEAEESVAPVVVCCNWEVANTTAIRSPMVDCSSHPTVSQTDW